MKRIVLARIDDRLVHGQIITAWVQLIKATAILIIDEELTNNSAMQRIYMASYPANIGLYIMNPIQSIDFLKEEDISQEVLMILVKVPQRLEELMQAGINIEQIILGGMGSSCERRQLIRNVFISKEEIACMKRIIEQGISIQYQLVPDDKGLDITKML